KQGGPWPTLLCAETEAVSDRLCGDAVALEVLRKILQRADTALLGFAHPLLQALERLLGAALLHQCHQTRAVLADRAQGRALGHGGVQSLATIRVQPAATV